MTTLPLGPIHTLAADTLVRVGWTQGTNFAADGSACLTGALKLCAPVPGDWLLARAVFRRRRHAETWNDDCDRDAEQVIAYLRSAEITNADLALTFGPQWEAIVALVRRASALTVKEGHGLAAAWDAARAAAWAAAWDVARAAAAAAARDAAWEAARAAAWDVARDVARDVAADAACALVVRDLIGRHGLTQAHYDTLTGPWAQVIGLVHSNDAAVTP